MCILKERKSREIEDKKLRVGNHTESRGNVLGSLLLCLVGGMKIIIEGTNVNCILAKGIAFFLFVFGKIRRK